MPKRRPLRSDFDTPWKEALEHFLTPFLAFFYPEVHAGIDWAELETTDSPSAQVVLAHLRALETRCDPEGRRRYKVQLIKGLYRRGWTPEDVRQLLRVIDWMLDLPPELQQGFEEEIHEWEEENRMPYVTSFERSGMEKGSRDAFREAIALALATKFGSSGKRLMPRVRGINGVEELRALLMAILSADNLGEVRDRLPPREG
jgi:hypothetical protein